jgi:hypothetical protein
MSYPIFLVEIGTIWAFPNPALYLVEIGTIWAFPTSNTKHRVFTGLAQMLLGVWPESMSSDVVNSVLRITMRISNFTTSQKQYAFTITTHIIKKVMSICVAQNRHHKNRKHHSAEG